MERRWASCTSTSRAAPVSAACWAREAARRSLALDMEDPAATRCSAPTISPRGMPATLRHRFGSPCGSIPRASRRGRAWSRRSRDATRSIHWCSEGTDPGGPGAVQLVLALAGLLVGGLFGEALTRRTPTFWARSSGRFEVTGRPQAARSPGRHHDRCGAVSECGHDDRGAAPEWCDATDRDHRRRPSFEIRSIVASTRSGWLR